MEFKTHLIANPSFSLNKCQIPVNLSLWKPVPAAGGVPALPFVNFFLNSLEIFFGIE